MKMQTSAEPTREEQIFHLAFETIEAMEIADNAFEPALQEAQNRRRES